MFLNDPALLPLASLAFAANAEGLLQRVVQRVDELDPERRTKVSGYTQSLAGLKFKKDVIWQLFREGVMRESVIYQDILEEGRQEGERL